MSDDSEFDNDMAARRRIAAVLLDLVSAADADEAEDYPADWAAPFGAELWRAGAVTTRIDTKDDELHVSVGLTELLAATAMVMDVMLRAIAEDRGLDRLAVLSTVRESIESPH